MGGKAYGPLNNDVFELKNGKGWIREYPIGAYDSQSITVEAIGGITNGNQ